VYLRDTIHESPVSVAEYCNGFPSKNTLRFVTFATRVFAIVTLVSPVVPEGPATVKLSSRLVELNDRSETVELDATEKTFSTARALMAKLYWELASQLLDVSFA
jgi:hypothetical protein